MYFVFMGKDKPGMAVVRQETRPAHRSYIYSPHPDASLVYGAPLANDDGEMVGTLLLLEASTRVAA